ncbi:hypothetical protein DFH29DRAFT_808229 [Suillus ampliporus]|nr:hypothetical protein DFH29DRAFT_808229 [Suillus ampliporus]
MYFGDQQSIRNGQFNHLIVSPEQLFMFNGHLPRLARLMRQDGAFVKRIKHVHIDEAHNIYTAGLPASWQGGFSISVWQIGGASCATCQGYDISSSFSNVTTSYSLCHQRCTPVPIQPSLIDALN